MSMKSSISKNFISMYRTEILKGLEKLPEGHNLTFRRMYSHKNLEAPINEVVFNIPEDKLDWALTQIENSLKKLNIE